MSYLKKLPNDLKNSLFCGFKGFLTFNLATISLVYYSLNSHILSILLNKQGESKLENKEYEYFKTEQEKSLYQLKNNIIPFLEVSLIMPSVFLIAHYVEFHKLFKHQHQMYISCMAICMTIMVLICFSLRILNLRKDCPCGSLKQPVYNGENDFLSFNDPTRKEIALNYITKTVLEQLDKEITITLPSNIKKEEIENNPMIKALRNVKYGKCDKSCRANMTIIIRDLTQEKSILNLKTLQKKLLEEKKSEEDLRKVIKAIMIVALENNISETINKISKEKFYNLVNQHIIPKENAPVNLDTLVSSLKNEQTNSQSLKNKYRALYYFTIFLTLPLRLIHAVISLGLSIINIIEIPFIFIIEFAKAKFKSSSEVKNTLENPNAQSTSTPPGSCCSTDTQSLDNTSKISFKEINCNLSNATGLLYGGLVRDPLIIMTFGLICIKNQHGLSPINHIDKIVATQIEQIYSEKTK